MSTDPPFNLNSIDSSSIRPSFPYIPPYGSFHSPSNIFQPSTPQPLRAPVCLSVEDFVQLVIQNSSYYEPRYGPIYSSPSINPLLTSRTLSTGFSSYLNALEQASQAPTYINDSGLIEQPQFFPTISTTCSHPQSFGPVPINQHLSLPLFSSPRGVSYISTREGRSPPNMRILHPIYYLDQLAAAIGVKDYDLFRKAIEKKDKKDDEFLEKCLYYKRQKEAADLDNSTVFINDGSTYQMIQRDEPLTWKQWTEFKMRAIKLISTKTDSKYYYCNCIFCLSAGVQFISVQYNSVFNHILSCERIHAKCTQCYSTHVSEKSVIRHKCRKKMRTH